MIIWSILTTWSTMMHLNTLKENDHRVYLKQTVNESSPNTEDSVQPSRRDTRTKDRYKENTYKCSDECKINPKSNKNFDVIQCSMCMIWYHEKCVGISKNEPIGLWL